MLPKMKKLLVLALPILSISPASVTVVTMGTAVFAQSCLADTESFEFIQYDKTAIDKLLVTSLIERNQKDRTYFIGTVDGIETEFKNLINGSVKKLRDLSSRTVYNGFAPMIDFASAVSSYKTQRDLLDGKIQRLNLLANGGLPSQAEFNLASRSAEQTPRYEGLDFSPLTDFYTSKLEEVDTTVRNLEFRLTQPNGVPYVVEADSGLGLTVPKSKISVQELRNMKTESRRLRTWKHDDKAIVNDYTKFLRQKVQQFVFTYGKSEKWRWQDQKHLAQMKKEAQVITDAFWTRSYFRAQYGMPLGAIGFRYKKSFANLDRLFVSNAALTELLENPVWGQNDYIDMTNSYQNALKVSQERSTEIFRGNVSYLTQANEFFNWISGESQFAVAANMMLKLLAADLYEETLIIQVGGKAKMISYYESRYKVTPEDQAYYGELKTQYESSTKEPAEDDFYADVGVSGGQGSSLSYHFRAMLDALTTKETELNIARELDKKIAIFDGIQDSPYAKRRAKSTL